MNKQTNFLVAMYLRLSREDNIGEKGSISKAESNSIGSQREMIRSFLNEQEDMELYDSYVDDGYSGSNFHRPEFKRMMQDVEAGRVNCVVVKDDCVIIELNAESPIKRGFCAVSSIF